MINNEITTTEFVLKEMTDPESNCSWVIANIYDENKIIGYLCVLEWEKPFVVEQLDLIMILCKVISLEMKKDEFFQTDKLQMHDYFLRDLLDGKISDQNILDERLKSINWNLKRNLFVLTITKKQMHNLYAFNIYLKNHVMELVADCKSILYNNYMVLLISRNSERILSDTELNKLSDFLVENKMHAGLSSCFSNLLDIAVYFKQSLIAMELRQHMNSKNAIYRYENTAIIHLVEICSRSHNLMDFYYPSLMNLIEYDQNNNTFYTKSLYAFLLCNADLVRAANSLHIHRNSMSYRMKKIQEIMGVSLNDPYMIYLLFFSFVILRYLKKIDLSDDFLY